MLILKIAAVASCIEVAGMIVWTALIIGVSMPTVRERRWGRDLAETFFGTSWMWPAILLVAISMDVFGWDPMGNKE